MRQQGFRLCNGSTEYDACGTFKGDRKLLDRRVYCLGFMDERILKEIGAPQGYKAVAPLIFGYPEGKQQLLKKRGGS